MVSTSPETFEACDHKLPVTEEDVKKENKRVLDRLQRAQWLRAAILGGNDGLLSTTSLMIGVGAAKEDQWFMILSGIAGALAGACSMAVGEFVSVSTQRDIELAVIQECPLKEKSNLQDIKLEIPNDDQAIPETKPTAIHLSPRNTLAISSPARSPTMKVIITDARTKTTTEEREDKEGRLPNPYKAGGASALSFLCGSLFPLAPAMAVKDYTARIVVMVLVTSIALALFGGLGARMGGSSVRASTARVLIGGWISMGITFSLLKSLDNVTDKKYGKDD